MYKKWTLKVLYAVMIAAGVAAPVSAQGVRPEKSNETNCSLISSSFNNTTPACSTPSIRENQRTFFENVRMPLSGTQISMTTRFPRVCVQAAPYSLDPSKTEYIQQLKASKGAAYATYYAQCLNNYGSLTEPVDVVFLGDSLTERGRWEKLSESLRIQGMGISQDTIPGIEVRLDQVAALKPHTLFLLIGINDLSVRWRPEVYKDYERLFDHLEAALPDTKVYVQSILPVRDDMRVIMSNQVLSIVNQRIKKMAEAHSFTFIDVFHPLLDPKDNRLYFSYQIDGLHLSESGYEAWETVLLPYLQDIEHELDT